VTDQVTYHLPANITWKARRRTRRSPGRPCNLITKTASGPGQITIARIACPRLHSAKPEEYQDLRGFYQKVAAADQGNSCLVKTAPAAERELINGLNCGLRVKSQCSMRVLFRAEWSHLKFLRPIFLFSSAADLSLLARSQSPALLSFAQFQPPTPDELKMTADPKAPGAAAVYL
jgi:hypothetical protein